MQQLIKYNFKYQFIIRSKLDLSIELGLFPYAGLQLVTQYNQLFSIVGCSEILPTELLHCRCLLLQQAE